MTPDYTYGHTVTKSVQDYLTKNARLDDGDQPGLAARRARLRSYLLNVANSGADVLINVNWGHDAVLSIQQAKQFGVFDKMKLVVPYQIPFLAREVGGGLMAGRLCRHRLLVDAARTSIRSPRCSSRRSRRSTATSRNGARKRLHAASRIGRAWSRKPAVLSAGRHQVVREGRNDPVPVGEVHFRKEDHQCVRPVVIVKGKAPKDMKNKEDFYDVVEIVPGEALMQKPDAFGCKLGDYT